MSVPSMRGRYRNFFWPAVFIVIGVIALLINTGVISSDRLSLISDLWPVVLIVIGLEVLARRALHGAAGEAAAVLIVVVAVVGALGYLALAPAAGLGTHSLDASGPASGVDAATVQVDVGAANITMTGSTSLGGDLYRAHITYAGRKPDVTFDRSNGTLHISQSNNWFDFQSRNFVLSLTLNANVPWTITDNTGAATETLSLGDLHLASIELNTGASHADITLGTPSGIVPISINGGALTVTLHRPPGTDASVSVSGGAVNLNGDGRQTHAIGDANWATPHFDVATDGYRVDVNGGACNVTMDTAGASG